MNHELQFQAAETKQITDKSVLNLRIVGGIQAILGVISVILTSVNLGQHVGGLEEYWFLNMVGHHVGCLVLSLWFIMTGIIPLVMVEGKENLWRGLKITFMVLSIIGSAVAAPSIIIIELIILAVNTVINVDAANINRVILCIAAIEFVMAIVSASFCCCCSPLTVDSQVQISTNVQAMPMNQTDNINSQRPPIQQSANVQPSYEGTKDTIP